MHLKLIKNEEPSKILLYKIARIIYAETCAVSLKAVEALASMLKNYCIESKRELEDIISDVYIFESLDKNSERHDCLLIDSGDRKFQMCLRVVARMLDGSLEDSCFGATRFHREEHNPEWATARGTICELDGLLFYI